MTYSAGAPIKKVTVVVAGVVMATHSQAHPAHDMGRRGLRAIEIKQACRGVGEARDQWLKSSANM